MLEKNKDYVEFTLQCTTVERSRDRNYREVCFNGYSNSDFPGVPMDVVCKEFDHKVVMISKRDFDRLQTENERLRQKINELRDDISGRSTVIESYKRDVTRLQSRAVYNAELARQWEINHDLLLKKIGFDTVEELVNYLNSEAECDTLHEAIKKLDECEKDYISERDKAEALEKEIDIYSRTLKEWKEGTGCQSPSAAKTLIESGMSWHHAYNEIKKANEKLGEEVAAWQNVTGYSIPEDYLHARLNSATPFDYTAAWQKATGCDSPCDVEIRIKALNERIDESEACYNHLLNLTGFESEGEIEDALDKCDHSSLRKALVDYEFDYEELLKLTGYKSNQDIRVALNHSEQFVYESMRELINSLKRQAKFTNLNWQNSTGFITPEKCGEYIKKLENKLSRINTILEEG